MTRLSVGIAALCLVYLATGMFIVRGNEQALVRRFGRAVLPLKDSGLHYDLPWPLARIDRILGEPFDGDRVRVLLGERQALREELVEHDAQRVDIGSTIELFADELLGRHVRGRTGDRLRLLTERGWLCGEDRDAEVGDHVALTAIRPRAAHVDEDVLGLQISMHDSREVRGR